MSRNRRHSHQKHRTAEPAPEPADLPAEVDVRLGHRPVMTSKGPSDGSHTVVRPGVVLPLPRHEAENLVNLGYATYV